MGQSALQIIPPHANNSRAISPKPTPTTSRVDNTGIFPGAFLNQIITGISEPAADIAPITREDAFRGVAELGIAMSSSSALVMQAHICILSEKLLPFLAAIAKPSQVQIAENILIQLERDTREIVRREREGVQIPDSERQLLVPIMCELLFGESSNSLLGNKIVALSGLGGGDRGETGQLSTNVDYFSSAIGLLIAAHAVSRCYYANVGGREQRNGSADKVQKAMEELASTFDQVLEQRGIPQDVARLELKRISPSYRAYNLVRTLRVLSQKHYKLLEKLSDVHNQNPFCGPKIILQANEGKLFEEAKGIKNEAHAADEESMNRDTFVLACDGGAIKLAHLRYDSEWGLLQARNSFNIVMKFRAEFLKGPDDYDWQSLASAVNVFPFIDEGVLDQALCSVSNDPRLEEYLDNKQRRYGPRLKRNKPWLEGKIDRNFVDFLSQFSAALKGEPHNLTQADFERNQEKLRAILQHSYFSNQQSEEALLEALVDCVLSRKSLANYSFKKGNINFAERLRGCILGEGLLGGALVVKFSPEELRQLRLTENDLKAVVKSSSEIMEMKTESPLTEFGLEYILDLIDPKCVEHERGDDCIELQELNTLLDHRRYG